MKNLLRLSRIGKTQITNMKKKPKHTIRRLLVSTGVALLAAVSADAVTLRKDGGTL